MFQTSAYRQPVRGLTLLRRVAKRPKKLLASHTVRPWLEMLEGRTLPTPVYWINLESGDWGTPSNWSTGQLPGPDDEVVIDVPGDITVTHSTGTSVIRQLSSQEALILSGGSLTLEAVSVIDNVFRLTWPGALRGAGDLNVNGAFFWSGGTMSGSGRTVAASEMTISTGGIKTLDNRTLDNAGKAVWNAIDVFRATGTGTLNNLPGAVLAAHTNAVFTGTGLPAQFHNAGTFRKSSGTGISTISSAFSNSGQVEVLSGRLNLGGGNSTGTFAVAAGTTLGLAGHTLTATARVRGEGNVTFTGTNLLAGAFTLTGHTTLGSGTLTVAADATFAALTLTSGTLTGTGNVTVTGALTWVDATISGTGRITARGSLTISGNGQFGRPRLAGRVFDNAGVATWIASTILEFDIGAVFNNLAGATFDFQTNAELDSIAPLIPPTTAIHNAGTFRKSDSVNHVQMRVPFHNTGLVEVEEGTLQISGGGTASGTFTVAERARLAAVGFGYTFGPSSRITGLGSAFFLSSFVPGSFFVIEGDYDLAGHTQIFGGVSFARDVTLGEVSMYQGGLASRGLLTVNGRFLWAGGTLSGAGRIRINGNLTITEGGLAFLELGSVNLDIAGHTVWERGTINALAPSVVAIEVLPGATFETRNTNWLRGSAGTFRVRGTLRQLADFTTFDIDLFNEGVVEILRGDLRPGRAFTNRGTVGISSGAALDVLGPFTNFARETATLTGGNFRVAGTLRFIDANLRVNAADLVLDGPTARVVNQAGGNALTAFASNAAEGVFTLQNGHRLTLAGGFTNAGIVGVDASSTFTVDGMYIQQAGFIGLFGGVLTAPVIDLRAGFFWGWGVVAGDIVNAGQLDVGGPLAAGSLRIAGNYRQTNTGVLNLEIGGTDPGSAHDQFVIDGLAVLDGTLNLALLDDFFPEVGDAFQVLLFGARQGDFATINGLDLGGGFFFEPAYDENGLSMATRFEP